MIECEWSTNGSAPQLLVSVRNAAEAADALAGGADIIDVKEPSRGPLGASDRKQIEEVLECVGGRRIVSMAAGELLEARPADWEIPVGIRYVKFGLSQCERERRWMKLFGNLVRQLPASTRIVPVVYADWRAAQAPAPESVLELGKSSGSPIVLIDTFDKRVGRLFDTWEFAEVKKFVNESHEIGTAVAVAGGLRVEDISRAVEAGADVIGVRGAVCAGNRRGRLQPCLVERVRRSMRRGMASGALPELD